MLLPHLPARTFKDENDDHVNADFVGTYSFQKLGTKLPGLARTAGILRLEMQEFRQLDAFNGASNRSLPVVFRYLPAKWQLNKMIQDCIVASAGPNVYSALVIKAC